MSRDPRVDAYIAKAAPFAQPILKRVREAVHAGCPEVEESIKWGVPAFEYKGPLCGMAAFKRHCMFGFWKHQLMQDVIPKGPRRAFGQYGRIASIDEVPRRSTIVKLVRAAKQLNDDGVKVPRARRTKKPPVRTPAFLVAALKKNARARVNYEAFPPSHKREYVDWLTDAKTIETRDRRLAQAIEWMAAGKGRNWKYEK